MDITVPCPCPGTPHPDGDTVTLRDKPTLHMGTTALGWASKQATEDEPTSGDIAELYLREGILSWTFVEDDGSPRVVDDGGLDWFLDDYTLAYPVAEAASGVYTDLIFAPLLAQVQKSSPTSRTGRSTSARRRGSRSLPKP